MQYKVSSYMRNNNDNNGNSEPLACAYVQAVYTVSLHMCIPFSLQKTSGFQFYPFISEASQAYTDFISCLRSHA